MYCTKCGAQVPDDMKVCTKCGYSFVTGKVETPNTSSGGQQNGIKNNTGSSADGFLDTSRRKMGTGTKILIAVLALIIVGFLAVAGIVGFLYFNSSGLFGLNGKEDVVVNSSSQIDNGQNTPANNGQNAPANNGQNPGNTNGKTPIPAKPVSQFDMDEIDECIKSNACEGMVAISVIDNKTGKQYNNKMASSRYSAWGFYLPIYLVNYSSSYSPNIMSSDAATCNSAANQAMTDVGGTQAVNAMLQHMYPDISVTSYGRKFGDTKSSNDNYTCASEAAFLVNKLYERNEYAMMSYDYSRFGISAPSGAKVYSQVGTENIKARKNLNFFAVIKGSNSDYSIAVLTNGYASGTGIIDLVLKNIHDQMESL